MHHDRAYSFLIALGQKKKKTGRPQGVNEGGAKETKRGPTTATAVNGNVAVVAVALNSRSEPVAAVPSRQVHRACTAIVRLLLRRFFSPPDFTAVGFVIGVQSGL